MIEQNANETALKGSKIRIAIIMPVYNDWDSFSRLVTEIDHTLYEPDILYSLIAVDDGSRTSLVSEVEFGLAIKEFELVVLATNLGHQRAIALGIAVAEQKPGLDFVAVMDSDGEDTPGELKRLVRQAMNRNDEVVVAQRRHRSEGLLFRLFYKVYRTVFFILTGQRIDFGNFTVVPKCYLKPLASSPLTWNNFAASLLRLAPTLHRVPTTRGLRYFGQSKMNFVGLIAHGLGAMSVFSEVVFIRTLLASLSIFISSALVVACVIATRLLTDLAVPGWTTNVLGFALLAAMQAVMLPVMMAFLLLSNRSGAQTTPRAAIAQFIDTRKAISPVNSSEQLTSAAR